MISKQTQITTKLYQIHRNKLPNGILQIYRSTFVPLSTMISFSLEYSVEQDGQLSLRTCFKALSLKTQLHVKR